MIIKPIASGSSGNCYIVSDEQTTILLDAGIPFRRIQEATKFKIVNISAAFITHAHLDHSAALCDLVGRGVDVYAPMHTIAVRGAVESHRAHPTSDMQQIQIGTFVILPFLVQHDVPCNAYLVYSVVTGEKLLYITDAQYSPHRFNGLTHILLEANYDEKKARENMEDGTISHEYRNRVLQTHMSIETAIELLRVNDLCRLQQIYLIHLSDKNALADEFKRRVQAISGVEVIIC